MEVKGADILGRHDAVTLGWWNFAPLPGLQGGLCPRQRQTTSVHWVVEELRPHHIQTHAQRRRRFSRWFRRILRLKKAMGGEMKEVGSMNLQQRGFCGPISIQNNGLP